MTKDNPTGLHPLVAELRAARILAGMSMNELMRKTGLNISTISEMEAGHYWPMLRSLEAYASGLNMKLTLKDMKVVLIGKEEK